MAVNQEDLLKIVTPKAPPDPLAIKQLPVGDPLAIVESADDQLDVAPDKNMLDVLESVRSVRALQPGLAGPTTSFAPDKFEESITGLRDTVVAGGQDLQRSLRTDDADFASSSGHRKLLSNVLEVGGQIPSSVLEQVGTLMSFLSEAPREQNPLFAIGKTMRDATKVPDDLREDENLADKFSTGLTQTAGFFAGGQGVRKLLASESKKVAAWTAAWLGSAVGGQAGREDAQRHGAEEWQVATSEVVNSMVGLSEGLPISAALGRIDDFTGGWFSKKFASSAGQIAAGGIEGFLEEALQEGMQTFGENFVAAEIAEYDPTRSLSDNIMEAATIGGSVGLLINLVATSLGVRNRVRTEAEIKEKILDPLGLDSLDQLGGAFSTVDDNYLAIQKRMSQLDAVIEERAKEVEGLDKEFEDTLTRVSTDVNHPLLRIDTGAKEVESAEAMADRFNQTYMPEFSAYQVNKELEGEETILSRMKKTPVVLAMAESQKTADRVVPELKKGLDELIKKDSLVGLTQAEKKEQLRLEKLILVHEATVKEEKQLAKDLKSLTAKLMNLLPKGSKVVITNQKSNGRSVDGEFQRFKFGSLEAEIIHLNTQNLAIALASEIVNGEGNLNTSRIRVEKARVLSTFLHEFGHAIGYTQFQAMFHKIEKGTATAEETKIWKGIENDYKKFILRNITSPADLAMAQVFSLPRANKILEAWGWTPKQSALESTQRDLIRVDESAMEITSIMQPKSLDYFFSMREYFAEEFSKIALGDKRIADTEALPFFKSTTKNIKRALEQAKGKFQSTSPTMVAYFRRHSLRQQLKNAIQEMQEKTEQDPVMALVQEGLIDTTTGKLLTEENDKFNRFMDVGFNILQIAEQNPHIRALQDYVKNLRSWKNEVNTNLAIAEERLREWKNLGQKENEQLARILLDETIGRLPDGGWLAEPRVFTVEEIAKYGLSDAALEIRAKIKEDFRRSLSEMETVLIAAKQRIFKDDSVTLNKEVLKVQKEFKDMKSRPYFPLMRFGEYTLQIYAVGDQTIEGKDYKDGALVEYQTFDTKLERDKAERLERRRFGASAVVAKATPKSLNKAELNNLLKTHGQNIQNENEAQRLFGDGYQIFIFHEQDETQPRRIKNLDELKTSTPDLWLAVSPDVWENATTAAPPSSSPRVSISSSKQIVPNFSLQGMPLTLLEHLESKLVSTGITDEVKKAIQEVKNDVLPFKSFRKQFQRRKRVAGFSLDAQRAYANYMTSFSNHIARVKFDSEFKQNFENLENSIRVINRRDGADTTKRSSILNHMNDHLNYVMNPVNEFVGLRSAAFFWFLGFNVKSAFVNLTQIPLVTYPYLAARFGDGRAVAQLTRANGTAIKTFANPKSVDKELMSMIEQGLAESWLDESLATELALAASEKNLDKSLPRKTRQQIWLKLSHYGSLPFHVAEKFNRHVTAIAAYRLAKADGKTHKDSVEEARRAVEKTQFEYARWARPRFQRGKVGGTVFVFQNYMQNALYFALGGDPGAFRMLIMLLLIAGLQGLPFGENIMDLMDAAMTALKRRTGAEDPHTQVRVDLRKMLKDMELDPDLFLHGMSSSTFGFANIGEFMGWPIPDIDLSGSLSMGRIVPGTELIQPGREQTFERFLAGASERAGGAIVSGVSGVGQALFDAHPDQWKRWEKAMPAAMRNVSKALRIKARGGEATRGGDPIATFSEQDPRDQAELMAQTLGFTPRDVSQGWEGFIAEQQAVIYYETWKAGVLRHWNYARNTDDEEGVKAANAEIREYNDAVPFGEMRIGPETRRQSYKSYLNARKFNEAGIEQSKPFRRLSTSIQAVFEEGDSDRN